MPPCRSILFVHAGAELYGADKILRILARGLAQRGWRVTIVLPWAGDLKPLLEQDGAEVVVINHGVLRRKYFSPRGLFNRATRIWRSAFSLSRLAKERQVDVIHSNTSVVMAGAVAALLARVPHVWHIHEITTRPIAVWRTLSWLIPRAANTVACVSTAVLAHLSAGNTLNARKGVVIHNGIDPLDASEADRARVRAELGLTDDDVLVGMVGRVNAWKGQMALAEAAAKVVGRDDKVRFLFVGGTFAGEEGLLDALRQRTAASDLHGRAIVWDFRKDVAAIMAALDIFVLPSTQPDPLPTVVLEAMSLARPVVAFAHGGVCEMVIAGETGLLVPPCEQAGLADAIERLAEDPVLRRQLGDKGRARFQEKFSVSAFLDAWEATYEKAIAS